MSILLRAGRSSVMAIVIAAGMATGLAHAQADSFPFTDGAVPGSGPGGGDSWVELEVIAPMYNVTEVPPLAGGSESYCTAVSDNGWIVGGSKVAPQIINGQTVTYTRAFRTRDGGAIENLGTLPGLPYSSAYGVNNNGDVVGIAALLPSLYGSTAQPFLVRNATWYDLDPNNLAVHSGASAINNAGWVVGTQSFAGPGSIESFKWKNGAPINLSGLPNSQCRISAATSINEFGVVVGYSARPGICGDNRAVKYSAAGVVQDLGTLGGNNGFANDVNNFGDVVGYSETTAGLYRATMWQNGQAINLGTLGGASFAQSVNDDGIAAGYYIDSRNQQRAAVWLLGGTFDLNTLLNNGTGWRLLIATGINSQGQIVGQGRNPAGQLRGFVLTPPCRSDFNRDGGIDGADVSDFLGAWSVGSDEADMNWDGGIDGSDVQFFFELWSSGRC